jgi:hypothetical protein
MDSDKSIRFFTSYFVEFTIRRIAEFLSLLKLKKENEHDTTFQKREPTSLMVYQTLDEQKDEIKARLQDLAASYPQLVALQAAVLGLLGEIDGATNALQHLDKYLRVLDLENQYLSLQRQSVDDNVFVWANKESVFLSLERFDSNLGRDEQTNIDVLSNILALNQSLRDARREPSLDESVLIQLGYSLIQQAQHLPRKFMGLGTYGFRATQTWLSLADPGEGHIHVTTVDNDLLDGVVVHVEHIDRDKETDKERVEAYRLPSPINVAKVRLHLGDRAPSTVYVGRPMFENVRVNADNTFANPYFKTDLLKTVHYTVTICNHMFSLGLSDCKIAIERMTVTESIAFMRAVVGNCQRDSDLQFLSAAFNINTPLVDDRKANDVRIVRDRVEVARLGIEIARAGGFDKITWDGASNEVPSRSIIKLHDADDDTGQLSSIQVLELVHLAHEAGLETYISAGMTSAHMAPAVYAGVDGVGIGTSLHYKTPDKTINGALNRSAILATLATRDRAQGELRGHGARLLATLDRLHYEGNLGPDGEVKRSQLYNALLENEEARIRAQCEAVAPLLAPFLERQPTHPVLDRAWRKLKFIELSAGAASAEQVSHLETSLRTANLTTLKAIL